MPKEVLKDAYEQYTVTLGLRFTSEEEGKKKEEGSFSYLSIYFISFFKTSRKKWNLLILALLLQFSPEQEMDSFKEKNKERLYCLN